jgi:plastocyanin
MKKCLCTIGLMTILVALVAAWTTATVDRNSGGQDKAPAVAEVKIDNFSFGPASLTVPVGTTVIWTNRDDIPHTVRSTDDAFKSKALDTDDQFSFAFTKPGTYSYFCSIHPKMTGQIVVQ